MFAEHPPGTKPPNPPLNRAKEAPAAFAKSAARSFRHAVLQIRRLSAKADRLLASRRAWQFMANFLRFVAKRSGPFRPANLKSVRLSISRKQSARMFRAARIKLRSSCRARRRFRVPDQKHARGLRTTSA
jgi:hypothetical protein